MSKIEKKIQQLMSKGGYGYGSISAAHYETAWVGRLGKTGQPMFPQCLEYLRKGQHSDGSWGAKRPFLIFDHIISTLAVIVCLKQWNFSTDAQRISEGQKFLQDNLKRLRNSNKIKFKKTAGFELILPSLIDEAKEMGLVFGSEDIIDIYRAERNWKLKVIKKLEDLGSDISTIKSWQFSLEGLGGLYSNEQMKALIKDNGIVCVSYSSTAYALLKGVDSPKTIEHFNHIIAENGGGIPHMYPETVFELAWGIISLLYVGFSIETDFLQPALDELEALWDRFKGFLGASEYAPLDPDSTANTLFVLSEAKRVTG